MRGQFYQNTWIKTLNGMTSVVYSSRRVLNVNLVESVIHTVADEAGDTDQCLMVVVMLNHQLLPLEP